MKIHSAIDGFLLWMSCGDYSPATQAVYKVYLNLFQSYVGPKTELKAITDERLRQFWSWFSNDYRPRSFRTGKEHPSISTRNNAWAALRKFYSWAEQELKAGRPDKAIPAPKRSSESPVQPFTEDEIHRLITAAEATKVETSNGRSYKIRRRLAERDMAIIIVLLDTGLRVGELCRLDTRDYNSMTGEITVKAHGTAQKTHGRLVYLGKRAKQALWRYLSCREEQRSDDPLFLSDEGRQLDRGAISQMLRRVGKNAGVLHCHPHRFRHTAAIQFLRNGGNIFVLQRILGHNSLTMVKRYLQLSDQDTQTAMQQSSPADRWRV